MNNEENLVVQWFLAQRTSTEALAECDDKPEAVPKVRRKDILELNDALAPGNVLADVVDIQKLADFNFHIAIERYPSDRTLLRKCARTVLRVTAETPLGMSAKSCEVCRALDLFKPRELGYLGYKVCMRIGSLTVPVSRGLTESTRDWEQVAKFRDRAASLCDYIKDISEEDRKRLQAAAIAGAAGALMALGDLHSAQRRLQEALALMPEDWAQDSYDTMRMRVAILGHLGQVTSHMGKEEDAAAYQEEAVGILRKLIAEKGPDDWELVDPLQEISELHAQLGRYDDARATLAQAISIVDLREKPAEVPPHRSVELLRQLADVLKAGGWQTDAEDLINKALRERGVGVAARLGHDDALHILRIANPFWMEDRTGEHAKANKLPKFLSPEDRRLLHILNADRKLVKRIAAEWQAIADSEDPNVLSGAVTTFGGWQDGRYWEDWAEFYRCVLILQSIAHRITEADYRRASDTQLTLPGFCMADIDALRRVLRTGAAHRRHEIGALPPEGDESWPNDFDPSGLYYPSLPPETRVDLCVYTTPFRLSDYECESDRDHFTAWRNQFIWEAFGQLVAAARTEVTKLRKCQVPRGLERHRDYLLGERNKDASECGTFYITIKDAHTCGRPTCKKSYTALQHLGFTKDQLWERAKKLAEREFRKADVRGEFLKLWQQVKHDDPKQTLLHFRELLRASRRNRR